MSAAAPGPRPNFFLVGAQKCGTTSLAQYLAEHPAVFMTVPKEPFYFASDFPGLQRFPTLEAYLELYRGASPEATAVGEASACYLRSATAIGNLRAFAPAARIVVMLREPIALARSFHAQNLFGFDEDEPDFARAWELQDARRGGQHLPARCRVPEFLQYREVGLLGAQLERLLAIFPREQVHLVFFEDFMADTGAAYRGVLDFLGVPDDGREDFPRMNAGKQHRFPRLMALVSRRPPWLQAFVDRSKQVLGPAGWERLQGLYAARGDRQALPPALRAEMREFFRADTEKLAALTGRDLAAWLV